MLDCCLFAVRADLLAEARRGAEAVRRLYAPLGAGPVTWREGDGVAVGAIGFGRGPWAEHAQLSWGNATDLDIASASDEQLRGLPGPLASVSLDGGRALAVTAAPGFTSLYEAVSPSCHALSTHAVAASYLARGGAELDPGALPELVACELVGGERTLLRGVRALPQAWRVELDARGVRGRSFWPAEERWAPLDPGEALGRWEEELLAWLDRAARGEHAWLGLTDGLDSRAAAVALHELGTGTSAFTFGDPASADARGAAAVAAELGMRHELGPLRWWDDSGGRARLRADVLWNEGVAQAGFGEVPWPARISRWLTGTGGETGRAFYYAWAGPRGERPSRRRLERTLHGYFVRRMVGASADARARVRERCCEWVAEAVELGHHGWSALDVVYAEQRVRRWGRGQAPRLHAAVTPVFAGPPLLRALASLPLEQKLSESWQREFISRRRPALAPAPAPGANPPRSEPARRRALVALRELRWRVAPGGAGKDGDAAWFRHPPWDERQSYVSWLRDDVLRSDLVREGMGERWAEGVRARFAAGSPDAATYARWAAGAVALQEALARDGE